MWGEAEAEAAVQRDTITVLCLRYSCMKHRTAFHDREKGVGVVEDWRTLSTPSNIDMRLHGSVVRRKADRGDGWERSRRDGRRRAKVDSLQSQDKSSKRFCLA